MSSRDTGLYRRHCACRHRNGLPFRLAALVAAAWGLGGCAHVEVLSDGSTRVTGFVRMTIPAAIPLGQRGAETLEVTTIGLGILSTQGGGGISLGYTSDRITWLKNNALVYENGSKNAAHIDQEKTR